MEAVYDTDGNLVTDTLNGGTYNFAPPDEMVDHTVEDVVPYLVWGNGPIIVDLSPRPNQDPEAPSGDEAPGEGESEEEPRKPELPERPLVPSRD